MPEQTTSAEQTAAPAGGQPNAEATSDANDVPAVTTDAMSKVMHRLGISAAVREGMAKKFIPPTGEAESGQATTEEGQEAAGDEGESTGEEPQGAQPQEGEAAQVEGEADDETKVEAEGDEEEVGEEAPKDADPELQKLKTKVWKQRKRAQRAETRAAAAEAQALELTGQLEKAAPVFLAPTLEQPLAHVIDQESLAKEKVAFRQMRDQALLKPAGWVENPGTDNEYVVSSEEATQRRIYAENVLSDHFPRKEKEIAEVRPAANAAARAILPDMFKVGTPDHQVAKAFRAKFPEVAARPEGDHLTAVFCMGLRTLAAMEQQGAQKNGKLQVPPAILRAHADKGKVTVQKQKPPGRSSMAPSPSETEMQNALADMRKTGGSREALAAGIKALNKASTLSGRTQAPV